MGKAKTMRRWVKLTLYTRQDADVIALVEQLTQCGRLSQTVIAALRAYQNAPISHQEAHSSVVVDAPAQELAPAVDEAIFAFQ